MSVDSVGLISASIPVSVAALSAVWAIRQDASPLRLIERVSALLDKIESDSPAHGVLSDVLNKIVYTWGLRKLRPKELGNRVVTVVSLMAGFVLAIVWVLFRAVDPFPGSWWSWAVYVLSIVSFVVAILTARERRKKIEDWTRSEWERRHVVSAGTSI